MNIIAYEWEGVESLVEDMADRALCIVNVNVYITTNHLEKNTKHLI